jgi:hypothetical protein
MTMLEERNFFHDSVSIMVHDTMTFADSRAKAAYRGQLRPSTVRPGGSLPKLRPPLPDLPQNIDGTVTSRKFYGVLSATVPRTAPVALVQPHDNHELSIDSKPTDDALPLLETTPKASAKPISAESSRVNISFTRLQDGVSFSFQRTSDFGPQAPPVYHLITFRPYGENFFLGLFFRRGPARPEPLGPRPNVNFKSVEPQPFNSIAMQNSCRRKLSPYFRNRVRSRTRSVASTTTTDRPCLPSKTGTQPLTPPQSDEISGKRMASNSLVWLANFSTSVHWHQTVFRKHSALASLQPCTKPLTRVTLPQRDWMMMSGSWPYGVGRNPKR